MNKNKDKIRWDYDKRGNYWCGDRDYGDGCCSFIYYVYPEKDGYIVEACNNAYGAERVAVKSKRKLSAKPSVFHDLEKLMKDIEERKILWLYTGFCNCVGEVTKEEY